MNIVLSIQEIEDNKVAILSAIKQLDLYPDNESDKSLADRLALLARRLDEIELDIATVAKVPTDNEIFMQAVKLYPLGPGGNPEDRETWIKGFKACREQLNSQ